MRRKVLSIVLLAAAGVAAGLTWWLTHGSRPEEIAQARANVESAKADVTNARRQYERLKTLLERSAGAVSQQDVDNAKAALDVAEARLAVNQKALELAVAGPRQEEV